MDWARILAYVTGTVDQELLGRNEYLAAENRIMKAQLKGDRSVRTTSEARPQDSARPRDRWIPVPFPPPLPPCVTFSPEIHAADKAHMPQGWARNS